MLDQKPESKSSLYKEIDGAISNIEDNEEFLADIFVGTDMSTQELKALLKSTQKRVIND